MRKIISILLLLTLVIPAFSISASVYVDEVRVILDGVELEFAVPPQIIDNRTMVPMRPIFEAFGMRVSWNNLLQRVEAFNVEKAVRLYVGDMEMQIGAIERFVIRDGHFGPDAAPFSLFVADRTITLDMAPRIMYSWTFIPLRVVSEALNAAVDWCGDTRTVTITTGS